LRHACGYALDNKGHDTRSLEEGETITPTLLAKRFTVNPVLVIVSLIFWFWMWGAPGAIIGVPMLAIVKIVCDRVQPLAAFGHFLEGSSRFRVVCKALPNLVLAEFLSTESALDGL
jgi:AI-2E family transporter